MHEFNEKNRVALLFTGGKDSTFSIEVLREKGYEISCLIAMVSENPDSYMLHTANINVSALSARALGIPIIFGKTKGEKESELDDIKAAITDAKSKFKIDVLASGGLSSNYQRTRVERIANESGLSSVTPLWGVSQRSYLKELVTERNYEFVLTSVSAEGLNEKWLGKKIDSEAADEILRLSDTYGFNPAFEGGEAETLVLDCPLFSTERLEIFKSNRIWDGVRGLLKIERAALVSKARV